MYTIKGFAFIIQKEDDKEVALSLPLNPIQVENYTEAHEKFASQGIKNYLFLLHKDKEETE